VLARGLDFVGVRSVVSFDFPATAADYVHRVGRVGRGGGPGSRGCVAVTLFGERDAARLRPVAGAMRAGGCEVPEWMLGLAGPGKRERSEAKRMSAGGGGGGGGGRGGGAWKRARSKK
jgi:ATP-dependent RNA helicase DDX52/ROK1